MIRSQLLLLVAGLLVPLCAAQALDWPAGQVNTTMCYWMSPRAAVIRDTLYIDGGYLYWLPGMSDGTYGAPTSDGNPLGLVYQLNFSTPFRTTTNTNFSNVFTTMSKAAGGGFANNVGPNYYDGAMFANDYEWWTYGGLLLDTGGYPTPPADEVAAYFQYASGPPKQFGHGYAIEYLPNGATDAITRYVTDGAAVSVPSENLGFYFSGLRSATWGVIYYNPGPANESVNADVVSNTLIELDMSVQFSESWSNYTLPDSVPGRANAEIVWVPVSKQGILVAIGGVIFPSYANVNQTDNAAQTAESEATSPTFMTNVWVYDIADKIWYEQPTSGAPGAMTQGCAVLASAQDGSSHNIYWYGGFDGLHPAGEFSDDVWVLSIPSFMWMKVASGTSGHGRAGHKCVKPYPDQMFVIGGYASLSGATPVCVAGNIVQIFNLSSAEWIDSYDPMKWSNYTVPAMIYAMIGGSPTGSATQTAPTPSGFANSSMTALFGTAYNSSKIVNWYPYAAAATTNSSRPTITPTPVPKKSPDILGPVLGVVLGLVFLTLFILGCLLWRRRRAWQMNGTATQSEAGTMDNRRWVASWLRATPVDAKAPTVTTDDTPTSPYDDDHPYVPEMGEGQVHEMMDTSRPVELHDTGFIPLTNLSNNNKRNGLVASNSVASHTSYASDTSTVSRVSQNSAGRPAISPTQSPRANSPAIGDARIVSGISNLSESDRGHLRGISETSVSTEGAYGTPMETPGMSTTSPNAEVRPSAVSPLSPPLAVQESKDYLGSGLAQNSPGTPSRRSNFSEELDEAGKK